MAHSHFTADDRVAEERLDSSLGQPVFITVDQLATMLQVSSRTVWRMRSGGQVPTPVRICGSVRWRLDDVRAWIAEGCPLLASGKNDAGRK